MGSGKIQFVAVAFLAGGCGRNSLERNEKGEAAIDGAVAAGEMVVGQDIGIFGGSRDTIGGAADQGDETVEHNERGKAAIDGAVAADETGAAQGTLDDGEGGGGGMAAIGIPDRSTMSRNQWKRFKEIAKRIQGRK